jgi:PemK-like, MazF-like toxin of type II toxin-antitoxin system
MTDGAGRLRRLLRGAPKHHDQPAPADTTLAATSLSYEPRQDGDPDPGEVVWAWVSYEEDPTMGKDRPVVIVGRTGKFLAGVALTSQRHDDHNHLFIGAGPWDPAHRDSWAKLDRILSIDPATMRRESAALDRPRFDALLVALRHHG